MRIATIILGPLLGTAVLAGAVGGLVRLGLNLWLALGMMLVLVTAVALRQRRR